MSFHISGRRWFQRGPGNTYHSVRDMTWEQWQRLAKHERDALRDCSGLSSQLVGSEGWRVAVVRTDGTSARFIVGRSTGWRPCSLELKTRRSMGGTPADSRYTNVTRIEQVR